MKNYQELSEELIRLKAERKRLEKSIVEGGEKVYNTIRHPAPIIKEAVSSLATDKSFMGDLITLGINFLAKKMSGGNAGGTILSGLFDKGGSEKGEGIGSRIIDFIANLINRPPNNKSENP